jgi:hypothetical protein
MNDNTTSIPTQIDAIHEPLRRLAKLSKRFNGWGRWLVATVPAASAGILIYSLPRTDTPELMRNATIAIGLGAGLLGAGLWIAGILLRSHLSHYRASRFEVEQQRMLLVAECERFVAGLDTTVLAGLVTQIQNIETLLPALRAAHELSTGQILMLLADVDRRWQADLTRVSDVGVKMIDGVSDQQADTANKVDRILEAMKRLEERVETAILMADAVAFVDARSDAEGGRGGPVASVTHLPQNGRSVPPRKGDHS